MGEALQAGDFLRAGRYEIQRLLRSASDKTVYVAHDRELGCRVAVDVFSNNSIMPSGLTVSAWEARVLGQLGDHPNIATVIDHWEDDETAGMVTRYLSGASLSERIERSQGPGKGLRVEGVLRLSTEIALALGYIHGRRILYRDLQPRNVLFDEWGTIRLVDFDTAVSLDDRDMSDLSHRPVIDYMAPELADGGCGDERADLYSLGATIYEMCARHPPFAGTREEILAARRAGPPQPLERDDLPEALRSLVFCLLAREREQRPASAAEVVSRLDGVRTARADLDRNLAENIEGEVLKATLVAFLNASRSTFGKSPLGVAPIGTASTAASPEIDLPPDHRLLAQAIMALAETDYRRAAIDAGTATEVALAWAISDELQSKELGLEFINQTIRRANGLDGLLALYSAFGRALPVSLGNVRANLAGVRNDAAHAGRIPSNEEASRAVELARVLVGAAHPFGPGLPS